MLRKIHIGDVKWENYNSKENVNMINEKKMTIFKKIGNHFNKT